MPKGIKKGWTRSLVQQRVYMREYRKKNRKKINQYSDKYRYSLKGRFAGLRQGARKRGHVVSITFEEYLNIIKSEACCYCGGKLPEAGGGIDRKKSAIGYTAENCVPACWDCNQMRGEDIVSYDEMFEIVKLLKRLRGKNVA